MTPTVISLNQNGRQRAGPGDRLDVAVVLLVLQSAIGLLAVAGTIAFGRVTGDLPNLTRAIGLGLLGPLAALALAVGLGRRKRWARNGAVAFEGFVLLGAVIRIAVGRGASLGLVAALIGAALPIVVLRLALSRPSRLAVAEARRPAPIGWLAAVGDRGDDAA